MITNIQGLRFLAAFAVCVLHVGLIKHDPDMFNMGGAGVDLFFVISGFIMVVSSQRLFGQGGATGAFLYQRITRIVPLYWIVTLVYLGLLLFWSHSISIDPPTPDTWERTIAGFFFFPIDSPTYWPLLNPGWSLNHEMLFYFLFAATIRFRQSIALVSVCALLCGLVVLGRTGIVHHIGIQIIWLNSIQLEFIWGIIAGVLYLRCKPHPIIAAISLVAGVIILARSTVAYPDREFFLGLPAALIVLGASCVQQIPAKSLLGRIVVLLGDSSYALYLLHWPLFIYENDLPQTVLLVLAVTLSIVVRLVVEIPILKILRRPRRQEISSSPHQPSFQCRY